MKTHLHFTFGPVQGFVAQARRTRDLYAGSFLLSHLAMAAMTAVKKPGEVILPDFADLQKMVHDHASAPNRFIARFDDEAAAVEAGNLSKEALLMAWRRIADAVGKQFLPASAVIQGQGTRAIWDRQISNFWDVAWVVGNEAETDLLDRRKNWRTPPTTVEGGDHCTLMGQWQELSGFIRSRERGKQDDFWMAVHDHVGSALDLEADERLCAIAFVKRFFPQVSKETIRRELDMQSWPSTVSIAAVPWLRLIKDKPEVHAAAKAYAELVGNESGATVSSARRIAAFENFPPAIGDFAKLSGNFLNRTALANQRGTFLRPGSDRENLLRQLRKLEELSDDRAGNFYALLLMDGDRMGRLIREHDAKAVTPCLTEFASKAPQLIENENHSGICVYAGGDDLLAMLPLDRALETVTAVRKLYVQSFAEAEKQISATISAGLVFAHYRCAFSRVLEHAHHLLDDVAKDGADRDALAIAVLKPGGVTCQWVGKFDTFTQGGDHCFAPLVRAYKRGERGERDGLTSSFLYNLRERFGQLLAAPIADPVARQPISDAFDRDTLRDLFVAEYLHGRREKRDPDKARQELEKARQLMTRLLAVCHQPTPACSGDMRLDLDGARLVKFLALDGKEGVE